MSFGKTELLQNRLELESTADARGVSSTPECNARYFALKNGLDRCLALVMLVPGVLVIGLLVLLVRLTSRGPAIYRQKRVGKQGHEFIMLKIRTMRHDAEAGSGAVWTQVDDPRITKLGWFLRKVHLDELPQLFNVLWGEMALVGPRPERPEFVAVLVERIPDYADRLKVLPGVTGLAQINLPPDTDLASVQRKQLLDLHYIRTASFGLDLRMLICTSLRLLGISGYFAARITRLDRAVPDHAAVTDHVPSPGPWSPSTVSEEGSRVVTGPELLRSAVEPVLPGACEPRSSSEFKSSRSQFAGEHGYHQAVPPNGNGRSHDANSEASGLGRVNGRSGWTAKLPTSRWSRCKKPK